MSQGELVAWATAVYVGLSLLAALILFGLLYRLLRRLVLAVDRIAALFTSDARARLLALGLALIVGPSVVPALVRITYHLIVGLTNELPQWLVRDWQRGIIACRSAVDSQCIGQLGFGFLQALGGALSTVASNADLINAPVAQTVILLALWAMFAYLLAPESLGESGGSGLRLHATFSRMRPEARQNLLFFALLALAGYLSIAAIAAIPGLQETQTPPAELGVERLRAQLSDTLQLADVGKLTATSPFQALEDLLASSLSKSTNPAGITPSSSATGAPLPGTESGGSQQGAPLRAEDVQWARGVLDQQKLLRQELTGTYTALAQRTQAATSDARQKAITLYEVSSVGRKGSREHADHFLDLVQWYRSSVSDAQARLESCLSAITRAETMWRFWAQSTRDRVIQPSSQEVVWPGNVSIAEEGYSRAFAACRQPDAALFVPQRPAMGSHLGPFGVVASWLLQTESLPLALIVGLLGFGLLGAACSTFVREGARRSRDKPLVEDLPGVVIRGVSAAVVVFLAVEGGLAIFAAGSSDPNPYVLLLTCLVAAVFSEVVWDWARRRLLESLGEKGGDRKPAGAKGEPPKPDAPPASSMP